MIGIVTDYDADSRVATISQRNRFFADDEIEIMQPKRPFFTQKAEGMTDSDGISIDVANHAAMTVKLVMREPVTRGAMLRKKRN